MIPGTSLITVGETLAAASTFSICVRPACHQRIWSFRNSFLTCAVVPVRSIRRLRETSKDDQSSTASPTALSISLGCASPGCAAGAGLAGAAAASAGLAGAGAASDDEAAWPPAGGTAGASSGGTSAGGSTRREPGFKDDPGNPALLLELSLMRASLGWGAARFEAPTALDLYFCAAHLRSPTRSVWSSCPLGRGGTLLQPGQVHSVSGTS